MGSVGPQVAGLGLRHMTQEKHIKVFQRHRVEDYALMTYVGKLEEIDRSGHVQTQSVQLTTELFDAVSNCLFRCMFKLQSAKKFVSW